MSSIKLLVEQAGLEAQFRLIPEDEEKEEGEIDDDDEDEEEIGSNNKSNENVTNGQEPDGQNKELDNKLEKIKKLPRISLFEMQSFLVALLLPEPRLSTPPSWCRVIRCMKASNVGIFLLDNVDLDWIDNKPSKFTHAFRFEVTPDWIEQLTSVSLSRRLSNQPEFSKSEERFETNLNKAPKMPRESLLLSPIQMITEAYPMPSEEGIKVLRSRYHPVKSTSPLFAIDCEMCITDKSELTRISIVDEEMRVVYNELVKPTEPITNYLTRYSGITKEMMKDVTTTLEDVQSFMRQNIPRDSIFCGHSLNMDLAAIKIFHPYVIDTSVIYNRTGIRRHKPSLKSLAFEFLGKSIQSGDKLGHDSLEDAITTMELVKLKLVNGILFGDLVAYEQSQGIKYDPKNGVTRVQIDKFIERHNIVPLSYRYLDTTPGARCCYVHDKQEPLGDDVKETISNLLAKQKAICVILINTGECYVKF